MGILRSCMSGEAAEWFDREITGKNWELSGITSRGGANLAAFVALVIPEAAGGPNAGTYVNGSEAQIYSRDAANAAVTIRAAFIPTYDLIGGDKAWGRAGARPTDRATPATADAGIAANDNHPIVFPGNQEPVVLKSKSSEISQEQLDKLLKAQAENLTKSFQVQIQELQKNIYRQRPICSAGSIQKTPVVKKPPVRYDPEYMPEDWYDPPLPDYIYIDENPDANLSDEQNQQFFSHIIESQKRKERELAKRIARKLRQAKDKREDRELAQAMRDLTLDDNSMDIDVVRGQKLELEEDDDGNIYVVRAGAKKK
ncbi:unnamed protein product [Rhizophagus irregularis]|nr:unnamed protein product [Rhizophagus irregularis]